MRTPVATIALIALCSIALDACGSGGSGSTTKTATVPSGTLGAQGGEHCDAETATAALGVQVISIDVVQMRCEEGLEHVLEYMRQGRIDGWRCVKQVGDRSVDAVCVADGNARRAFQVSWKT